MSAEMWIILMAIAGSFIAQSFVLWIIYDLARATYEALNRIGDEQNEQRRRAANEQGQ